MSDGAYGPHTEAWAALGRQAGAFGRVSISDLFASDPGRGRDFGMQAEGLWLDISRQRLDAATLKLLLELAEQTRLSEWIERMFGGERVNNTEDRAALHIALRRPADRRLLLDGGDIMPLVEAEREKMRKLADSLHDGSLRGHTGRRITAVVNIGIGGSDLGLAMALEALDRYRLPGLDVHLVSNVDGVQLARVLAAVDPETTLFVVCSKTFTTAETLVNARAVREWLLQQGGRKAVAAHFVAVSTNRPALDAFGVAPQLRLGLWDWVGGRFSICSAVGLVLAMAIGWRNFAAFLAGAHRLDEHFRTAPPDRNLPVLLALVGIWNRNFLGAASLAVLPYDQHLRRLPAYLQQLEMESNGKSVRRGGGPVECATAPLIWGEPGSNAQHSFYQWLHQGTEPVAVDFLLPATSMVGRQEQQDLAALNCLAQAWALAAGDPAGVSGAPAGAAPVDRGEVAAHAPAGAALGDPAEAAPGHPANAAPVDSAGVAQGGPAGVVTGHAAGAAAGDSAGTAAGPHRAYPGNRPASLILFPRLDPATLGKLVALYEHKVFTQGVIWDINSFDQWGVELGKRLTSRLQAAGTQAAGAPDAGKQAAAARGIGAPDADARRTDAQEADAQEADVPEVGARRTDAQDTDTRDAAAPAAAAQEADSPDTDARRTGAPEVDSPENGPPGSHDPDAASPVIAAALARWRSWRP